MIDQPDSVHSQSPAAPVATDPLNLSRLRLSQDFSGIAVKKALLTVPVRKPSNAQWIQVHPSEDYRLETVVLELKDENRETYLVDPNLWPDLVSESTVSARALFSAVTTQGVFFLWPVRLPGADGKLDDWNRSALEAAGLAKEGKWVRIQANMSLGAYDVTVSETTRKPVWPDADFQQLVKVAFKGRFIDSLDHPVLKQLRGEL